MIVRDVGRILLNDFVSGDGGNKIIVYISGEQDGATMQLQYQDELGNYVNLQNGVLLTATQSIVNTGVGMQVFLHITARDNTATMAMAITVKGMS